MLDTVVASVATYPGLLWLCAVTGLAIPMPEDLVVLYAGILVHEGVLAWGKTLFVVCLGMWVRDILAYWIGRVLGDWLLVQPRVLRVLGRSRIARARQLFRQHETRAVIVGRSLIGMRVPVFLVAGSMRVSFRRFFVVDGIGVLLTGPILLGLGYWLGEPFLDGVQWVLRRSTVVLWLSAAVAAMLMYRHFFQNRTGQTDAQPAVDDKVVHLEDAA